ncbi:MAG TPA: tetratricopeptide repeat protein, partial [Nitrososphaerales archaeon]|nr:tetratricopeptide repeat protein [Nitrososphaerales archaeon]
DSFLVEFESALGATNCAVEIQQVLHEHNLDSKDQIPVRVGIHVGDVVHQKMDIFGDAVNIASKIEPLAESGEICVSEQVYDQIRNKVPFKLSRLTPPELKDFSLPIGVYRMELSWERGFQDARPEKNRLAILPFANISADSNDAYFADGMTEELISTMAKINALQVIARTSVTRYKTATKSVEEIGKELKAGVILEGSVRKEGEKLRITAQLIDSMDGSHIWTEVYDRNLKDTFAIQSEIAEKVASALKLKLLPTEKLVIESVPTQNTKAHTLCLKGIYCNVNASSENDLVKAKKYFESAIELDSGYATAYSWLGDTYTTLCQAGFLSSIEAIPKAESAVRHALEIDPNLDNSHRVLGFIMTMRDSPDWTRAELETLKALEVNPNSSVTHESYAWILSLMGRLEEAEIEAKKALELDPFSHTTNQALALVFYFKRKYDEAIQQLQKTREFELENLGLSIWLGMCYVQKSMFEEAIGVFDEMSKPEKGKSNLLLSYLAFAYAKYGMFDEARKILNAFKETSRHQFIPALATAQIHAALGESDETIQDLERACNEGDYASLQDLKVSPVWDSIRPDPRFHSLLRKRGLEH